MKRTYKGTHFFILSKGNNAGKPLDRPCPNCFVVLSKDQHENELLFWLCYGLWQCGYFRQHLIGSVIPFLRIPELKNIIRETRSKIDCKHDEYCKVVDTLNKLRTYQTNVQTQLQTIDQLKKSLIWKLMK